MDLSLILAQLGAAAGQAGPALDLTSKAAEAGVATNVATNLLKGLWGGDVHRHPPEWFAPLCAVVLGVVFTALAALTIGVELSDPRTVAGVLLAGIPIGTGTSMAVQGVSNAVRPRPSPPSDGEACPTCGATREVGPPPAAPPPAAIPPWMRQ